MTPEQTTDVAELVKKSLAWQKRTFIVQLVQTCAIVLMVGMWLFLFMYSA